MHLDFGCGSINPLAIATIFILNGAKHVYSVDISPGDDEKMNAFRLYELLKECYAHPELFCFWENSTKEIQERLKLFDMNSLFLGNLFKAIRNAPVNYIVTDTHNYDSYEIDNLDLIVSYTVLEHVMPFKQNMINLTNLLKNDGLMCHYIDFSDHESKSSTDILAPWRFLTRDDVRCAWQCNRIRFSEMVKLFNTIGLTVKTTKTTKSKVPSILREKLLDQFKHLLDEDLEVTAALVVLGKCETSKKEKANW